MIPRSFPPLAALLALIPAASILAAESAAPAAVLTPARIQDVSIDGGFWGPRLELWQRTTVNDVFTKFETAGGFTNFDRVAAKQTGGHKGEPWWDGLIYETITASADFMAAHPDPLLMLRIKGYTARIAAAAAVDPDGYVNTACTLDQTGYRWSEPRLPGDKFDDNFPHTIYNAGCLVEAGVHLYRATGDAELLKVATRMANYMCRIMGPPPKQNRIPGHAVSEMAFVELYELYREMPGAKAKVGVPVNEQDYLKLAEFWIEARGHHEGRATAGAYNQDDVSVFQQPAMEGHAVRSGLLAAGMAQAAAVNGRQDYRDTLSRWWKNLDEAKMYITGGMGSVPSIEGFGPDHELPNDGYNETCASAAAGIFSQKMNRLTGDARYIDMLERELYNGALSGASLDGTSYFYTNFLSAGPDHRRWGWMGGAVNVTPCCPPMFLKLQSAVPEMIYATGGGNGVFVNLYASSRANLKVAGTAVGISQKTDYPWSGDVVFTVTPQSPVAFALNLRIPEWAQEAKVEADGEAVSATKTSNGYIRIERTWKPGDHVTLRMPMPIRRVKADPRVKANVGRVALQRGPVVYCLEGIDNGGRVSSLQMPKEGDIAATWQPALLGGITTLTGEALRLREENGRVSGRPVAFTAIPFYANANRTPTDMEVWIADDPAQVQPVPAAGDATPSASHCYSADTVTAINDGAEPKSSDDGSIPRLTWWEHRGTAEWAQLTFGEPRTIDGIQVYWWDESRVHRDCRVPQSWHLQYLNENAQWQDVPGATAYGVQIDSYNKVTFPAVTARALRLNVQLQPNWSAGILEWKIQSPSAGK